MNRFNQFILFILVAFYALYNPKKTNIIIKYIEDGITLRKRAALIARLVDKKKV